MTRRQKVADDCRKKDFNCAQCLLTAFGDLTGLPYETGLAVAGGLGGGIGCKEEVCGALSGAILVLGLLVPHTKDNDLETKRHIYDVAAEFRRRFVERFGCARCLELLDTQQSEADWAMAAELKSRRICAVFIVEAVRMLEEYLRELGIPA